MEVNDFDFEVKIKTPRFPTEDKERILSCLSKLFPKTEWTVKEEEIEGTSKYLTRFKMTLEDMQIRDTARNYMKNRLIGNKCSFTLSKQAACSEKINFSEREHSLGGVEVEIICDDIVRLIENLTEIEE
ncbi:MAG: hypothetical protein KGY76_07110 [Candidatus Thermoplasmatota archaeon]|nr:hypothetical protein [Candidatus Thermoplasmatota archaeon]